jgi:hypothetical protein
LHVQMGIFHIRQYFLAQSCHSEIISFIHKIYHKENALGHSGFHKAGSHQIHINFPNRLVPVKLFPFIIANFNNT